MRVLGFMSGTSLDGVDAAIIETDGLSVTAFGPACLLPFMTAERDTIKAATEQVVRADGLPITFSGTTGVSKPLAGGVRYPALTTEPA